MKQKCKGSRNLLEHVKTSKKKFDWVFFVKMEGFKAGLC